MNSHKNISIAVRSILEQCWESYVSRNDVTDYQRKEVEKALQCYGSDNGSFVSYCFTCDEYVFQSKGCNSRLCSHCGKRYTDQWSDRLGKSMFPVSHRHFVMSVSDVLWPYLRDWNWMKAYMNSAIVAFNEYFSRIIHSDIRVGVIVILHPFGKELGFRPHLHLLITEGGFTKNGTFRKCSFIPADGFRKKWQYEVLKNLQKCGLPNSVASYLYKKFPNGFYVWLHSRGRIAHPKSIGNYVGRYVRHPAIADSRIFYFDGKIVKFYYINGEDQRKEVTMKVDDFISALIQHIPPPQFKMIRHYGAYARQIKRKFGLSPLSSIKQLSLSSFGFEKLKYCPKCHSILQFIGYCPKPPPKALNSQYGLMRWISENSTKLSR